MSSNRNVSYSSSSSSSPTRRRRRNEHLCNERKISNRVATRLEDWLAACFCEEDIKSSSFLSSNHQGPRNETNMVYSGNSDDNEEQLPWKGGHGA